MTQQVDPLVVWKGRRYVVFVRAMDNDAVTLPWWNLFGAKPTEMGRVCMRNILDFDRREPNMDLWARMCEVDQAARIAEEFADKARLLESAAPEQEAPSVG